MEIRSNESLYTEFKALCSAHDTIRMEDRFENIAEDANHIADTYKEVRMQRKSYDEFNLEIEVDGKTFGRITALYNKSKKRIEFTLHNSTQRVDGNIVSVTVFSHKTEGGLLVLETEPMSVEALAIYELEPRPFTRHIFHYIFTIFMARVVESLRK